MQPNMKKVVSMLASEQKITLFTINGEVLELTTDGPYDTARLSADLAPKLTGGNVFEFDLNEYMILVKALNSMEEYDMEHGVVITTEIEGRKIQGIFYTTKIKVQVQTKDMEAPVEVPEVENLDKHMKRASDENSPAVRNFLRRLAPVIEKRKHSAEDLMKFIKKSEMPLTHDGKIIGYKRVNKGSKEGTYVDVHTGYIEQSVGSRVWMDVDLVDPNRHNSCSTGLHVANLGYLRGFGGGHTLIVLVDPADFIAVPHGETTKCRVCSYDIIGVMDAQSHNIVNTGKHVTDDKTLQDLIKSAVEGHYVRPFETVKVKGNQVLERLKITDSLMTEGKESEIKPEPASTVKETSGKSLNEDKMEERKNTMAAVKEAVQGFSHAWDTAPKEVIALFDDIRTNPTASKATIAARHNTSTRTVERWKEKFNFEGYLIFKVNNTNKTVQEKMQDFYNDWKVKKTPESLAAMVEFKKARKKGWNSLGLTPEQEAEVVKATSPKN